MSPRRPQALSKARFISYCLISLAAATAFQLRPLDNTSTAMQVLWSATPFIGIAIFHAIDDALNQRCTRIEKLCPTPSYTVPLAVILVLLGQVAIWTQDYLAATHNKVTGKLDVQAYAIHFAMAFWLLSDPEFYRRYRSAFGQDQSLSLDSLLDIVNRSDLDPNFGEIRDCITYRPIEPDLELPPRCGWLSLDTLNRHVFAFFDLGVFHLVAMACLNYPLKRFSNPNPNGESFPLDGFLFKVFFSPRHWIFGCLDFKLQRPIRWLNHILFWSIVEAMERAWTKWHEADSS